MIEDERKAAIAERKAATLHAETERKAAADHVALLRQAAADAKANRPPPPVNNVGQQNQPNN